MEEYRRLRRFRYLHRRSDCYRVERTSSRAGLPLGISAFSQRTKYLWLDFASGIRQRAADDLC